MQILPATDGEQLCAGIDYSKPEVPAPLRDHVSFTGWRYMREAARDPAHATTWHLTPGAIGCALSHARAWREVVARNQPTLVLEDDARMLRPPRSAVGLAQRESPEALRAANVLYLGYSEQDDPERPLPVWRSDDDAGRTARMVRELQCTHAYVVTPDAAQHLLRDCFPLTYQLDTEIWMAYERNRLLVPVALVPPCVVQDETFASSIQVDT